MLEIEVNGKAHRCPPGTVVTLLQQLGLDAVKVAVERNGEIIPRSRFAEQPLAAGDRIEIIHFVGGG